MRSSKTGNGEALSDAELVFRCRGGDASAFDELVLRHQDRIYNAVLRFCGNREDACDIVQRAFINAFRKIDTFKGDAAFTTWMYRIAFNQSVSYRREQRRHKAASLSARDEEGRGIDPAVEADPGEGMGREEEQRMVQEALLKLPEDERQIIVLRDLEGRSYDEIAAILSIPKGTVRSRLHRARGSLKELLSGIPGTAAGDAASEG